jgi:PAS domain S-box-containing protein
LFRGSVGIKSIENSTVVLTEDSKNLEAIPYPVLFQNLPMASVLLDLRNQVVIGNEDFEKFSGYRIKEIVGNDLIEILIPQDAIESAKFLFGRLLLGEKVRDKQIVRIKDGSVREVEINGVPILHREDQIGELIIIDEAFSARNDFSKEFERLKRLTEISQLIGGIGHELRNPFCIIKNSAYLVEKRLKGKDNDEVRKYLSIIRREAEIGNKIIANLLHFIRKREPQIQWIDPMKPIKEVLSRYPLPENVTLELNNNSQGFQILVDPDQIEVVLLNLITNAVQAMPSGGKLGVSLDSDDSHFTYQISDSGCGIPEDAIDMVFKPFFTNRRSGIGLGLAITKQLVEANQGKISIQSKVGIGTSFSIEFSNPMPV